MCVPSLAESCDRRPIYMWLTVLTEHIHPSSLVHAGRQPSLPDRGLPLHQAQHSGGLRYHFSAPHRGPLEFLFSVVCFGIILLCHLHFPLLINTDQLRRRRLRRARVEFYRLWLHFRAQFML